MTKIYYKYDSELLQIRTALLKITVKSYYNLRQLLFCKIRNSYKLPQVLLHIVAVFSVIINYGRCYKLHYYKLPRNSNNLCGIYSHHYNHQQHLMKVPKLLQHCFLFLLLIF